MLRLTAVIALTHTACVAGALPPSKTDVGSFAATDGGDVGPGLRLASGAHVASGADRPIPIDVGAGYVYEQAGAAEERASASAPVRTAAGEPEPEVAGEVAARRHGAYLEVSRTIRERGSDRAWAGARAEALWPEAAPEGSPPILGLSGRISWELFGRAVGAGGVADSQTAAGGAAYGTAGIGFYSEVGYRRTPDGRRGVLVSAGISVRLPFLAGVAVSSCF